MNPLLSSTIDFDSYIEDRLQSSRFKKSQSPIDYYMDVNERRLPTETNKMPPHETNQLLSLNAHKKEVHANGSSRSGASSNRRSTSSSTQLPYNNSVKDENSTKSLKQNSLHGMDTMELVHSWKRYTQRSSSPIDSINLPVRIPITVNDKEIHSYQNKSSMVDDKYESNYNDWKVEDTECSSSQGKDRFKKQRLFSSPNKGQNEHNPNSVDVARPFIGVKFRVRKLSRFFLAWKDAAKLEIIRLQHLQTTTAIIRHRGLCKTVMRIWFFLSVAEKLLTKILKSKRRVCFRLWRKRTLVKISRNYKADRCRFLQIADKVFRRLKFLVEIRYRLKLSKDRSAKLRENMANTILTATFLRWRSIFNSKLRDRSLLEEQNERRSKIQSFIQRLDIQRAPSKEVHNRSTCKQSGTRLFNQRNVPPTRSSNCSDHIHGRGSSCQSQSVSAERKRCNTPNKSMIGRYGRIDNNNDNTQLTPLSNNITVQDVAAVEVSAEPKISPVPIPPFLPSKDDSGLSNRSLPTPPSYHTIMKGTALGHQTDETFAMNDVQNTLINVQIDKEMTRKEKINFLRQQAMQRVHEKQKEQESRRQDKLAKEAEDAEKIRQAARTKKEQEKQKSMRTLALIESQNRKLKVAIEFHRKHLLICFGLSPWNRYMDLIWNQSLVANEFRQKKLLLRFWNAFCAYAVSLKTERIRTEYRQSILASTFHKRYLLAKTWKGWRLHRKVIKAKEMSLSGLFSKMSLKRKALQGWKIAFEISQRNTIRQIRSVSAQGNRCRMRYYFKAWSEFIIERRVDREINFRSERKWREVQNWIHK